MAEGRLNPNGNQHDSRTGGGRDRPRFHSRHRPGRPRRRKIPRDRDALPAGAERLSAYRPCQVDCPQFRHRPGICRPLPPALRRHQSDQGRAGIYRFDSGRRALARLRLGNRPLLRLGLFRAAVRMGGGPDPGRPRLCRRPVAGGNPRQARHADRARQEQPVPRPPGGGEPRSVPPHEGGRVSQRRAGAARQDRHVLRQYQPARPRAVSHPARHTIRAPATPGRSIRATTTPTASPTRSRALRTRSARWNSRTTGRSTNGCWSGCRCRRNRASTKWPGSI